jgi:glucose/arabinose dehydrogenase
MGLLDDSPAAKPSLTRRYARPLAIAALVIAAAVTATHLYRRAADARTELHRIRVETVAAGLRRPWSLAFLPGGDILVTEKWRGRLRIVRRGVLEAEPIAGVPAVHGRQQGGLLEVAIHPRFAENGLVYLTYSKPGDGGSTTALARGRFDGTRLVDVRDIFVAEAWSQDNGQYGSRLAWDRDGLLYMTVGDRRDRPKRAQDTSGHAGKLLRLRDDGSVPDDNPFVGVPGHRPEIFAYGFRCQQGLVIHPESGAILTHEHGPRGGDEINVVRRGANYGWPLASYGREYSGALINGGATSHPGTEPPVLHWTPSIGPSGMALYTGDRFPGWRGHLFVGALVGRHLRRVVLDGGKVVHEERLLRGLGQRIRDVRQGPDGLLYLVTDEDPGALLRLSPAT